MTRRGFTLIECLIGLALSCFIILAAFEFFGSARAMFFKIKDAQEDAQAACSALDKMRIDLLRAGRGLVSPMTLGLLQAVRTEAGALTILSAQSCCEPQEDLRGGDTRVLVKSAADLKKGTDVCVFDSRQGETGRIAAVRGSVLILDMPLSNSYSKAEARILGLETVSFYLDPDSRIIRRKVNSSPAQPLLEDVELFRSGYDVSRNLAEITFALADHKEKIYELCVYPKNSGLAIQR